MTAGDAFVNPQPPSGTHRDGRWVVDGAVNTVADTVLFDGRTVRALFIGRPITTP